MTLTHMRSRSTRWSVPIGILFALAVYTPPLAAQSARNVEGVPGVLTRPVVYWSDGTRAAADLYYPSSWREGQKLPALLLFHGYAGLKSGLNEYFAPAFAAGGYAVMSVDYRSWGESDGRLIQVGELPPPDPDGTVMVRAQEIRSVVRPFDQQTDIDAAISFMEGEPMVDANRIGIWGTSFAGGHVIYRAAVDERVKAVVSQVGSQDHLQYVVAEYQGRAQAHAVTGDIDTSVERRERLYRSLSARAREIERLILRGVLVERRGLIAVADKQTVDAATTRLLEQHNEDLRALYAILAKTGDYAEPVRWQRIQRARGDVAPVPQSARVNAAGVRGAVGDDVQRMQYLPRLYAHLVKVPTLILDVEKEQYIRQGEGIYDILKANGVPTSYYIFPGASHYDVYDSIKEECARRALEWFDRHLKGGR